MLLRTTSFSRACVCTCGLVFVRFFVAFLHVRAGGYPGKFFCASFSPCCEIDADCRELQHLHVQSKVTSQESSLLSCTCTPGVYELTCQVLVVFVR